MKDANFKPTIDAVWSIMKNSDAFDKFSELISVGSSILHSCLINIDGDASMVKQHPSSAYVDMLDNWTLTQNIIEHAAVTAGSLTALYLLMYGLHSAYFRFWKQITKEGHYLSKILQTNCKNDNVAICVICKSKYSECTFLECGHICVCVTCLQFLPCPKKCPACQCKVAFVLLHFS